MRNVSWANSEGRAPASDDRSTKRKRPRVLNQRFASSVRVMPARARAALSCEPVANITPYTPFKRQSPGSLVPGTQHRGQNGLYLSDRLQHLPGRYEQCARVAAAAARGRLTTISSSTTSTWKSPSPLRRLHAGDLKHLLALLSQRRHWQRCGDAGNPWRLGRQVRGRTSSWQRSSPRCS
jgi:hypothetical protein